MNKLIVESIYTRVEDPSSRMKRVINRAVRARPNGYVFSKKYKMGTWDGWISMYKYGMFPTGLLEHVIEQLREHKVKFTVADNRAFMAYQGRVPQMLGDYVLRDYQLNAVFKLMSRQNGIAQMATNAGKTLVYAAMASMLPYERTAIIVHSRDLLYQTAEVMHDLTGYDVGLVGDGLYEPDEQVVVISIDTLRTKYKRLATACKDVAMLIVDECHHTSAKGTYKLLSKFPANNRHRRYGASGTPLHYNVLDDLHVMGLLGPIVTTVTNQDLFDSGYSIMPTVHMHDIHTQGCKELTYPEAYDAMIVRNSARNIGIIRVIEEMYESGPLLVMVDRIEHGRILIDLIYHCGLEWMNVIYATGGMEGEERARLLDKMRRGDRVVVVSTIFREGIDVPNLCGLIIACGGSGGSRIKLLQMIGRVVRHKEGFNTVEVHDWIDRGNKHLHRHSNERVKLYTKEGFAVQSWRK